MTPPFSRRSWPTADVGGSRLHLPHGTTPALDSAMWVLALAIVAMLNIEAGSMPTTGPAIGIASLFAVTLQAVLYILFLRGRARFGTIDEIPLLLFSDLFIAALLTMVTALAEYYHFLPLIPVGGAVISGAVALTLHLGSRWFFRQYIALRRRPEGRRARRTIILGAGSGGAQAVSLMQDDRDSAFEPVAILDDDQAKRHLRISGVRVLGPWRADRKSVV